MPLMPKRRLAAPQQSVNSNQLTMSRTVVKAPIGGITSRSNVNVGALATAGSTQMVTVSQLNQFMSISVNHPVIGASSAICGW